MNKINNAEQIELHCLEYFKSQLWLTLHFIEKCKTTKHIIDFLHMVEDNNIKNINKLKNKKIWNKTK